MAPFAVEWPKIDGEVGSMNSAVTVSKLELDQCTLFAACEPLPVRAITKRSLKFPPKPNASIGSCVLKLLSELAPTYLPVESKTSKFRSVVTPFLVSQGSSHCMKKSDSSPGKASATVTSCDRAGGP